MEKLEQKIGNEKGFTLIELAVVNVIVLSAIAGLAATIYFGTKIGKALDKYTSRPVVEKANVIGGPRIETYIEKDGKRFYAEIDGQPIEKYLK